MTAKHAVLTSALSCLITLLAVFAVMSATGSVGAQAPNSPTDLDVGGASQPSVPELPEPAAGDELFFNVAGSTFTPLWSWTEPQYSSYGCTWSDNDGFLGYSEYNFPLTIPDGSTITSLRFYYYDSSASAVQLKLREGLAGSVPTNIATLSSQGDSGLGYEESDALSWPVDYSSHYYVLHYAPLLAGEGSTLRLCGARVGYIPPSIFAVALPHIAR
jgi:hypothetical protein